MTIRDDIKALGVGAPLRATYELSKRTVGHNIVFGRMVATKRHPHHVRLLPPPADVAPAVRQRTLTLAREISDGRVDIFSAPTAIGSVPDWHALLHTGGSWPAIPWWKIDIRSDARLGDVKWCWELGRFRHVVILARACWLEPADEALATALRLHVSSFLDQNPPEIGVHWYSNLELALRSFAWLQVLSLAQAALGPELTDAVIATLHHTGRHLVADLPYTVSTMRNNHLLGDAVGLCTLGYAFADQRFGRRWTRIGDRLIARFLRTARRPRGTFIEDSVSYHRFVIELLSARVVLGGADGEVVDTLRESSTFLVRLGALDGPVPQYGDWDEGRVLTTSADPCLLQGSVLAGLALAGDGADESWMTQHDEVAWYCAPGTGGTSGPLSAAEGDIGGGVARAARGEYSVWLKAPAGTSHNHADATALSVAHRGRWVIGDPGTGTYNGPVTERNYFRSSRAHDVLRLLGADQLEPHRAFRWKHESHGGFIEPITFDDTVVFGAWHDAFRRLEQPATVLRLVVLDPHGVIAADFVDHPLPGFLSIPLHPSVAFDGPALHLDGERFELTLPAEPTCVEGRAEPFAGWWSDTYGRRAPSTILDLEVVAKAPVVWSLSDGAATTEVGADMFRHRGTTVAVVWSPGGAEVRVTETSGQVRTRRVEW